MNKFSIGKQTDTEVEIIWTSGSCPTQDEVRDALQLAKLAHLKPVLKFDPKVVGYPFGKSLMYQKYLSGCSELHEDIWKMGVTAVYEWFLFDRYRTNMYYSFTPHYECYFIYTTYDVNTKYQNQTPGFAKKFPDIAKAEEIEWEQQRDKIEEWLAEAWRESHDVSYFVASQVDRYTKPQREDFWPESVPYKPGMSVGEMDECYKEFMEKELEYERCNPSKG